MVTEYYQPCKSSIDNELLISIRNDDRFAFNTIYNQYWSKLYLFAYNILRNREAAEDIVQDIFIQLWQKRADVHIDNLQNYLYTAVRYQVFRSIRDGKNRTNLLERFLKFSPQVEIESVLFEKEINQRLDESIALLPARCKEIFTLSRKEHLSIKEISKRLEISPKTIENQITIAIRRVRANMTDLFTWLVFLIYYCL
ncbi:RNA polymerase sigma-70 factor [Pedobacter arcticus]|uniref:RNA polymerase sigma-70 factor n=1 Tax=Pedobacter arcticus TaxID=752140 RepID=UPI0002E0CDED|nr:RNA polymerase sigma-70 factor [Pedobacter arcticus]